MNYIVYDRFKQHSLSGQVNLPAMTECEKVENMITYNGKPLCYETSYNAHKHFARNDDGQGLLRGKLIAAIQKRLAKRDKEYQKRWDKIWRTPCCQKYKRVEHENYWLWNHDFFNASIEDLTYIANLIGIKETSF